MTSDADPTSITPRRGRRTQSFPLVRQRPHSVQWPEADRIAWQAAIADAGSDPFDMAGTASHLSAASRRIREGAYGSYLSWLAANSLLDPDASGPRDRIRLEWVGSWMKETRTRVSARTAESLLMNLMLALQAMIPGEDWRILRRVPSRPTRAEVRAAIEHGRKPTPDTSLLAAKALELCEALTKSPASVDISQRFRDALIIAFACYHVPRLRNLAELRIDEHLRQLGDGAWWIIWRNTKNRTSISPHLASSLLGPLDLYLKQYRLILLGGREDPQFLWINRRSQPLASTAFRGIFRRMGEELIGEPLHPHQVRHGMATGLLKQNPRNTALASAALSHRSQASVNQVYDRANPQVFASAWLNTQRRKGFG